MTTIITFLMVFLIQNAQNRDARATDLKLNELIRATEAAGDQMMTRPKQIVMHCPCGNAKVLAKGMCSTCYTLKRQDEEYFGCDRPRYF